MGSTTVNSLIIERGNELSRGTRTECAVRSVASCRVGLGMGSVAATLWFALARAGETPGAIRLVFA
jgi:hypothetical protein